VQRRIFGRKRDGGEGSQRELREDIYSLFFSPYKGDELEER
jgi:hypothetical protein